MTAHRKENLNDSKSQINMIKESLLLGEKLTVLDGLTRFKCLSLSQRMSDLIIKEKWPIKKERIKVDSGKYVSQYSLYNDFKENTATA
jgi:hypothetical protein